MKVFFKSTQYHYLPHMGNKKLPTPVPVWYVQKLIPVLGQLLVFKKITGQVRE
jgi:hypothetical protein